MQSKTLKSEAERRKLRVPQVGGHWEVLANGYKVSVRYGHCICTSFKDLLDPTVNTVNNNTYI